MVYEDSFFRPIGGSELPRFAGRSTFMRLPQIEDPAEVDIALVGFPWDSGSTNRVGQRHGPREIRSNSTMMRLVHQASRIAPYDLCRIADLGDVPVNPIDIHDTLARGRDFYRRIYDAGAAPLTAGGDHLGTLPILRGIAGDQPMAMVQFDSHSDTNDTYFGDNPYTHGTPFRRAIEEGILDPKRIIQVGIRGSMYSASDLDWAHEQGIRVTEIEVRPRSGGRRPGDPIRRRRCADLCDVRCRRPGPGLRTRNGYARSGRFQHGRGPAHDPRPSGAETGGGRCHGGIAPLRQRRDYRVDRRHDDVRAAVRAIGSGRGAQMS